MKVPETKLDADGWREYFASAYGEPRAIFQEFRTEEVKVGFWHGLYLRITGKPKPRRYVMPEFKGDTIKFKRPHQYKGDANCQ